MKYLLCVPDTHSQNFSPHCYLREARSKRSLYYTCLPLQRKPLLLSLSLSERLFVSRSRSLRMELHSSLVMAENVLLLFASSDF